MNLNIDPNSWLVRFTGTDIIESRPHPAAVLEGIKNGDWDSSDLVRGPGEPGWKTIEEHPVFVEAIAELEPPVPERPDETHLDMNPLIDVALVLLIFFILTTTYSSLRRMMEVPPALEKGASAKTPSVQDIEDRIFKVKMWKEGDQVIVKVENQAVPFESTREKIEDVIRQTGRREMLLDVAGDVPWGKEARIHAAAKAAGVIKIYSPLGQ